MSLSTEQIDPDLEEPLQGEGYRLVTLKGDQVCGISQFIFTWAIVVGLDETGYSHRYCYGTLLEALGAYNDWDGVGDPAGFIKRKP